MKSKAPSFQAKKFLANDSVALKYNIYYPSTEEEKSPLFIFLHGAGERGSDNAAQLVHIAPILTDSMNSRLYPAILVFPQCPANEYWANVDISDEGAWTVDSSINPTAPMKRVIELIESIIEDPRVDTDRIYVGGLSMGGFGTFDLISRHPDWFAGAVAICGGGDVDRVEDYKNLPLWVFHGAKDPVVSVDLSRAVVDELKAMNGKVKYTEYPEGGHNIWNNAFEDPETLSWLFGLSK